MTVLDPSARPAQAGEFDVIDPATEEVCGRAPVCTVDELDRVLHTAARGMPAWSDPAVRKAALASAADVVEREIEHLATQLTREMGKPLLESRGECAALVQTLRQAADIELPDTVIRDDDEAYVVVRRRPIGVVAGIIPWNAPVALLGLKLASNLAVGNTMVIKPSPVAPLTVLRLGRLIGDCLPDGALTVVAGGDELGRAMVTHPIPRKISMTGSIGVGKAIMAAAATDLKRVTLELGGNDAAIVLNDVDVAPTASQVVTNAFRNAGQICIAIKRVYVHRSVYDEFVDAAAAAASTLTVGNGLDPGTEVGPLAMADRVDHMTALVRDSREEGAVVATGGQPLDGIGYFFPPTIVARALDGMRLVDDEQFGPVLPIVPFDDDDAAVASANGTRFGLGGSVWGTDVARARAVADRVDSGVVWINTHRAAPSALQPLSGHKWSGIGAEGGVEGRQDSTVISVRYEAR